MAYNNDTSTPGIPLEKLFDRISLRLIESSLVNSDLVKESQKTIRGGSFQLGRTSDDTLILYQKDAKANVEDLKHEINVEGNPISELQFLADSLMDDGTWDIVKILFEFQLIKQIRMNSANHKASQIHPTSNSQS